MKKLHRSVSLASRRARGFMLVEVLVAGLIFAFGVLGIVGLQAYMTKQTAGSKYRAEATYLAGELIGTMWSDAPNLDSYVTASCASHARCSAWAAKVSSMLPSGDYEITVDVGGGITVAISWVTNEGEPQTYRTQTSIVL